MPERTESYKTYSHVLANKGLIARYLADKFPDPHYYYDLLNLECRMENAISSRLGTTPITVASGDSSPMADGDVHSLYRIPSPTVKQIYRYAGAGQNIYRQTGGGIGAFSLVTPTVGFLGTITSISRASNVVTVVLSATTSVAASNQISIYGVTGASTDFNGNFAVTSVSGGGNTFTYSQTGPNESGANGFAALSTGYLPTSPLSGDRFSLLNFRPNGSSLPYGFFCDSNRMLKDNGAFSALQLSGLDPPPMPATVSLDTPDFISIQDFYDGSTLTLNNLGGSVAGSRVYATLAASVTAGSVQTVALSSMVNVVPGMILQIDSTLTSFELVWVISTTATQITAYFANAHSSGGSVLCNFYGGDGLAPGTTGYIQTADTVDLSGNWSGQSSYDAFQLDVRFSDPTYITEIRLYFDVGDGSFQTDYYWAGGTVPADQLINTGSSTLVEGSQSPVLNQQYAQLRPTGNTSLSPSAFYVPVPVRFLQGGLPVGQTEQSSRFTPPARNTIGFQSWARLSIFRSDFSAVGQAGLPGHDWSDVVAWRIQVTLGSSASSNVTVEFSDLSLMSGVAPNSTGGVGYDYRITRYNANTMAEGNPSPTMVQEDWQYPVNNPLEVQINDPYVDAQVTHHRIYRRGGSLGDNWRYVDQVAVGTNTYTDGNPDFAIASASALVIDNDPPVTSNLTNPVLTNLSSAISSTGTQMAYVDSLDNIAAGQVVTVDVNEYQETVIVQAVYSSQNGFAAYFQYTHPYNAQVTASTYPRRGCNLAAFSQNYGWYAGDPANPHFLYYSKPNQVEVVPPQNYIEVGTPSDPIMAVIDFRGQTYVFTKTTAYQIVFFTSVPQPLPTACRHGLAGSFAWTKTEGAIIYLSYDGVYEFAGGAAIYLTEKIEWIFFGDNFGPTPQRDKTKDSDAVMGFYNNEVYLAYTDVNGTRRRIIYSLVYKRWRPDDVPAFSMCFEEDVNDFILGSCSGTWQQEGMVYQDRSGDSDIIGYSGGKSTTRSMPLSIRTMSLDQNLPKQDKIYNETTFDVDTSGGTQAGQVLSVVGWFDETQVSFPIGSVQSIGRHQQQVNVNEGIGQLSRTCALQIQGNVTRAVHFYQVDFRYALDAEPRKSLDTYFLDFGVPNFKSVKQTFVEYLAPDPSGITFNVYLDGSGTSAFSFTLPQAQARTAVRIRFPAYKARLWRFIATSPTDCKIYSTSWWQWKIAGSVGGYKVEHFQEPV